MHVAVILPRWVGDAIMATPMLRALKTHLGDGARVTAVARPLIGELLDGNGWFDRVIPYDRHRRDPALGFAAATRQLRADRPDVALVLPGSLSAAALAWCGGARRRIGLAGGWRRPLLTDVVGPRASRRDPVPPPAAFMAVAAGMGVAPGSSQVALVATAADLARGDALLAELFPGRSGPLVVLNDNSANGSARAWGTAKHATLAAWLVERITGCRVLVHCGPGDRQQARAVVDIAAHPAVRGLADVAELPIGLSKALYARAALAVTSDSGPRHIAAAFRVPTVALLGPTDPRLGRSDPDRCQELRVDLACAPCGHASCPLGHHDCMRLLDVEQVGRAALALWQRSASSAPEHRAG